MIDILENSQKFSNLSKLSFLAEKSSIPLTEELIRIGKNRAYSVRGKGISIMVDVVES
jgi:hypothetical protein